MAQITKEKIVKSDFVKTETLFLHQKTLPTEYKGRMGENPGKS